jgi:hypothetical protein
MRKPFETFALQVLCLTHEIEQMNQVFHTVQTCSEKVLISSIEKKKNLIYFFKIVLLLDVSEFSC